MHGRSAAGAVTDRPDAAAHGGDRIRTPVQPDAVVGVARLGGESLVENPLQIAVGDSDAVVFAMQMQLIALGVAHDLRGDPKYTLVATGLAHGVGGVDDEVLQYQPQHRAGHVHHAHAPQGVVRLDHQPLATGIGYDFE